MTLKQKIQKLSVDGVCVNLQLTREEITTLISWYYSKKDGFFCVTQEDLDLISKLEGLNV